jgi:hypothetical protein
MELITAYLVGVIVLIGMFAVRRPHEDVRIVFILGLFWPLSILAILGTILLNATGWDMDMAKGAKMFGFRKPTNPKMRGFAFTVLYQEFQFFKGI